MLMKRRRNHQVNGLNFDEHLNKLKEQEETCEKHGMNLVQYQDMPPFCQLCVAERVAAENKELSEKGTEAHLKSTTYKWLNNLSIVSDETLAGATFDSYEEVEDETAKNKEHARQIAGKYLKGQTFNTLLSGKPGTGKSHLAMSILQAVNEHSDPYRKCLFVSVDELMRRIKSSFNNPESKDTEERLVNILVEADLLVLDDLGAETGAIASQNRATDFTTRTLYAIVNGRMNKSTIITTNLSSKEVDRTYDRKLLSRLYRGVEGNILTFNKTTDKRAKITY